MKNMVSFLIICILFICTGCNSWSSNGALIELTPEGNQVWKNHIFENPTYFSKTLDGDLVVADLGVKKFVDVDKKNEIKWSYKGSNPVYVQKTKEGNYFVVNQSGEKSFLEVNPEGDIVWEMTDVKSPNKGIKLDNGNYLLVMTGENLIKEVDKNNNVVWSTPNDMLKRPYDIKILKNGNYLVTDFDNHRVIEIDKNSKVLWEHYRGLMHPVSAVKLDSGDYVIADKGNKRVIFIDKEGLIKKEIKDIEPRGLTLLPNGNVGLAAVRPKK